MLWFVVGPVRYSESALSPRLVRELQEWEQSYYDGLTPDYEWRSPERGRTGRRAEGERLAQLVADELGSEFEIDFADRRFRFNERRGESGRRNRISAIWLRHFRAERERIDRQYEGAGSGSGVAGWYAQIPGRRTVGGSSLFTAMAFANKKTLKKSDSAEAAQSAPGICRGCPRAVAPVRRSTISEVSEKSRPSTLRTRFPCYGPPR